MLTLLIAAITILFVAIIFSLVNFRFLTYPLFPQTNPMRTAKHVTLDVNVFFISDLHLRADHPFNYSNNLRRVLQERQVSQLVVVGDLFDSPEDAHRMLEGEEATRILRILGADRLSIKAYFVHGSPPHDPASGEDLVRAGFDFLGECAILSCGAIRVVAYHGHDLSRKGMFGHGWDRFISNLSLERAWKQFAGVPASDWVIFGHLHIPGIDTKHRVANCGGWQSVRILVRPGCTGLFLSPNSNAPEVVKVAEPKE
jgi:UDP-2,3-diacylglucosamine pyrophosphatase LpxH